MSLVPSDDMRRLLEEQSVNYHMALLSDVDGPEMTYLMNRGITKEAVEHFRIGVVADPPVVHEKYVGRLSFPYLTRSGVVSIRFRRFPEDGIGKKFLSAAGDQARIYNASALQQQPLKRVFMCEGEADTIAAWQSSLTAVGIPGATNWNDRIWSRVFRDVDVCVLVQNDDGGDSQKMADVIYASLSGCDMIKMPEGMDVSEFVRQYGESALREKVGFDA